MSRKKSVWLAAGLAVIALLPVPATAQDRAVPLSLKDCLRMALANNLDLVSARKDPQIAEQQIEQTRAPFDGVVSAGSTYDTSEGDGDVTSTTTLPGGAVVGPNTGPTNSSTDTLVGDASFTHLLEFGGQYSLTYSFRDTDFLDARVPPDTGVLTSSEGTQSTDGLRLNYTMPLLSGFGVEANTVDILLARGGRDISREQLRLQTMSTLQSVEDAYWDVLAAGEALRTFRLSLKRAEDLLELNKKKVEVGTLAPIEITEAEAGVAAQVEAVIVGETNLEDAEDVLLQLMAAPQDDDLWVQSLELTDRPTFVPVEVDLDAAIEVALENRPEMATAAQQLRNDELSERVSRRNRKHGLDLTANLSPDDGFDDERRTVRPDLTNDTLTNNSTLGWDVGLRYTYRLHNRAAKADYAIKRINREKSEVAIQSTEQTIRVDVRRSARNLTSGVQRVQAAQKNVELQKKKLDAENKKLDNGMSTSFEVLTFQNDLANAELSEIRARLDYLKSLTALERSKGTLLEARGLSLGEE